jgi:anti-sigma factor ChrR (cupin superfamily)
MSPHLGSERCVDLVFGELPSPEEQSHLADCPLCRQLLAEAAEGMAAFATALRPVPTPVGLRARITASLGESWERFLAGLQHLTDLSEGALRQVMLRAKDPGGWVPGPLPAVELFHFAGGARTGGADVGLVRMPPAFTFPRHDHVGTEEVLLLEGSYTDDGGRRWMAGMADRREPGQPHSYTTGPEGVMFAIVLYGGIQLLA